MWILELGGLVVIGGVVYKAVTTLRDGLQNRRKRQLIEQSVLTIVDKRSDDILGKLSDAVSNDSYISLDSMIRFNDELKRVLDAGSEEISVVIHTRGGMATAAEAIARSIVQARQKGARVIAYVPYYAFSGGCLIALSCDEIRMSANAVLGPADGQLASGKEAFSVKAICDTVSWQIENAKDKVKAEWYAKSIDAGACRQRQRAFVDELVGKKLFSKPHADRIYEELFSGKYNHDQGFGWEWAAEHHLPASLVEQMPEFVQKAIKLENGKKE